MITVIVLLLFAKHNTVVDTWAPADVQKVFGIKDITENKNILRELIAEFIGTFLLIVIGVGSCVGEQEPSIPRIALAFGLAVAAIAQVNNINVPVRILLP